jgi:hypothetical protein
MLLDPVGHALEASAAIAQDASKLAELPLLPVSGHDVFNETLSSSVDALEH